MFWILANIQCFWSEQLVPVDFQKCAGQIFIIF
jgi:hypothetical protein